ncbi:TPA: hypothetical protein ACTXXA_002629 [Legionella anisa]
MGNKGALKKGIKIKEKTVAKLIIPNISKYGSDVFLANEFQAA